MQSNNRSDWSKGLAPVTYAINTSSAQTIKKSPYEVVFGQKPRCDIEMWQVLSDQGILNEDELPLDFIDLLNECDNATSVVEVAISSDATKSPASQVQSLQTTANLYLPTAPSPAVHISPRTKKRRRARLFSNDQVTYIDKDEATDTEDATLVTNHTQIRAEAEVSYMANIAKRQKLFNDVVHQNEYKVGDLVGLKIDKVDRTNVTPRVLPCKIISVQVASNDMDTYQLCTTTAILFSRFQVLDLLNLSKCNFRDLRDVDSTTLPTMTFIQACKAYVSAGLITPTEAFSKETQTPVP
ncbi:unnamed protein product [Rotaria magnacalcarata]|uniref:Uncharacterized protein n=1 Tax=Rotaria magnacalcarata TaxID=392030 RepID=A0A816WWY7_9BILA|nr:unnamed protein product [Rotaria magnacalcarata]CAF4254632.1 unnamed protein product [Rotaria magnacalcarata]